MAILLWLGFALSDEVSLGAFVGGARTEASLSLTPLGRDSKGGPYGFASVDMFSDAGAVFRGMRQETPVAAVTEHRDHAIRDPERPNGQLPESTALGCTRREDTITRPAATFPSARQFLPLPSFDLNPLSRSNQS